MKNVNQMVIFRDIISFAEKNSQDTDVQVGCAIVDYYKDGSYKITYGTNLFDNDICRSHINDDNKNEHITHAEINALSRRFIKNAEISHSDVFITHAPCLNCTNELLKNLISIDNVKFVELGHERFIQKYSVRQSIKQLQKRKVDVEQVSIKDICPS